MKKKINFSDIRHPDRLDFSDVEAKAVLEKWENDVSGEKSLFSSEEYDTIRKSKAVRENRETVYLSYENPWGKSGGVAAVADMLPKAMSASGIDVIRISPFHGKLKDAPNLEDEARKGECSVTFGDDEYDTTIYLFQKDDERWYLFHADGFFEADGGKYGNDPYVYSEETKELRDGNDSRLLRDSLFASAAIPEILRELGFSTNIIVHAQDWEFASCALTVKEAILSGKIERASVVLTLHNPFDHSLSDDDLGKITRLSGIEHWPAIKGEIRNTVLTCMIPLLDAPVSTVSRRFAQEFLQEPLQTGHFAGHYQEILGRKRIIGIDNGIFETPKPLTSEYEKAMAKAAVGSYDFILEEKLKTRKRMLEELEKYLIEKKDLIHGTLDGGEGKPLHELDDDIPVFLMIGRLDPGQKGFDVFARFIEKAQGGKGRYIISPLSPFADDEDFRKHFDDLVNVSENGNGEVVFIPFRLDFEIFLLLRSGVTWSIWPSLYEPFGGVSEFYIHGTPVIARATGGLAQQVIGYDVDPEEASGILYRENPSDPDMALEVVRIQETIEPQLRMNIGLYVEYVDALSNAMENAVDLYQNNRADYGRILANLPGMHQRLSWRRSVDDYLLWYDTACL